MNGAVKNYVTSGVPCCVTGCGRSRRNSPKIKLFKFPSIESLYYPVWCDRCGISKDTKKKSLVVCERHFSSCVIKKRRLTAFAVPTLHLGPNVKTHENQIPELDSSTKSELDDISKDTNEKPKTLNNLPQERQMEIKIRVTHLEKYVPFIDFISTNEINDTRLQKIKGWILSKKFFKQSDAENMKKYIYKYYRESLSKKKLPPSIESIFNFTTVDSIDLCSDDEDQNKRVESVDLCSDDEIISIKSQNKQEATNSQKTHADTFNDTKKISNNEASLFKRRNEIMSSNEEKECISKKLETDFLPNLQKIYPTDSKSVSQTVEILHRGDISQSHTMDIKTPSTIQELEKMHVQDLTAILNLLVNSNDNDKDASLNTSVKSNSSNAVTVIGNSGVLSPKLSTQCTTPIQTFPNVSLFMGNTMGNATIESIAPNLSCLPPNTSVTVTPRLLSTNPNIAVPMAVESMCHNRPCGFTTGQLLSNYNGDRSTTTRNITQTLGLQTQQHLDVLAQVQHVLVQNSNRQLVQNNMPTTSYRPNLKDPRIQRLSAVSETSLPKRNLVPIAPNYGEAKTYGEYLRQKMEIEKAAELKRYEKSLQQKKKKEEELAKQLEISKNVVLKTPSTPSPTINNVGGSNHVNTNPNPVDTLERDNGLVNPKRAKRRIDKVDRALKHLAVDCIGYNEISDFVTTSGKRQSGISARAAIALQLNLSKAIGSPKNLNAPTVKENRISKRRKTINNDFSVSDFGTKDTLKRQRRSSICMESAVAKAARTTIQPLQKIKPITDKDSSLNSSGCTSVKSPIKLNDVGVSQLNQCRSLKVLLRKIASPLKHEKSVAPLAIKLVPTKVIQKESQDAKNVPNFTKTNTNKTMTEKNTKICLICKSKPHNLTSHFIGKHKTESYVARLTNEQLDNLRVNIPYAELVTTRSSSANATSQVYAVKCQFCSKKIVDEFQKLYDHYSTHTGEYAYGCYGCGLLKPFYQEVKTHTINARRCAKVPIQRLYIYPAKQMVINIYSCKICNFVQLNAANVDKHLREQHGKKYDPACIEKHVLASIQNDDDNEDVDVGAEEIENDVLICNELLLDEPLETAVNLVPSEIEEAAMLSFEDMKPSFNEISEKLADNVNSGNNDNNADGSCNEAIMCKSENLYRHDYKLIPKKVSYFGLFKCMGAECFFSTNNDTEFISHINDHQNSECPAEEILTCAYCSLIKAFNDTENLIKHIEENHERSIYQCYYCCYRSCEPANVLTHQQEAHIDAETIIVKCDGRETNFTERFSFMLQSMAENVHALICDSCELGFYAISSIVDHKRSDHGVQIDERSFKKYECIYCHQNYFELHNLQQHLVEYHPNEYSFVCERTLRKPNKDDNVYDLMHTNIAKADTKQYIKLCSDLEFDCVQETTELDVKPGYENLLTINEETVKALLLKLTKNSGISPDRLYVCSNSSCSGIFSNFENWLRHMRRRHGSLVSLCPHRQHCKFKDHLDVEKFDEHFKHHCRQLYVCFHCAESFANSSAINEHVFQAHSYNANTMRVDRIEININYTYFISIHSDLYTKRLDFLQSLQDVLRKREEHLQNENSYRIASSWAVPLMTVWLEHFPSFSSKICERCNCMVRNCNVVAKNMTDLITHTKSSHPIGFAWRYMCSICNFITNVDNNWDVVETHLGMHGYVLFICCACSYYHFDRSVMARHCQEQHDLRDVPIVSLNRSNESTNLSLAIVFSLNCISFSTMRSCFCCGMPVVDSFAFVKHLKDVHKLKLCYSCEYCSNPFKNLSESSLHFKTVHSTVSVKIRCEIKTFMDRQLNVKSLNPLEVHTEERVANLLTNNFELQTPVKVEQIEELNDIEILEDDEVEIMKNEVERQNKPHSTSHFSIKCVNVNNLM